jgi:hypothetical protein
MLACFYARSVPVFGEIRARNVCLSQLDRARCWAFMVLDRHAERLSAGFFALLFEMLGPSRS